MIVTPKLYLLGASCSGVSTLGAVVSRRLNVPQIDVDDFYWMPTDPPFSEKRDPEDRIRLIRERQQMAEGWVLTGSFIGWGDSLIQNVDLIAFLYTAAPIRLERLDQREARRHGGRILPGGDMHQAHLAFRDWASRYDDPLFGGRSLVQHERWLKAQTSPVLRLDGARAAMALAEQVEDAISRPDAGRGN